MFIWGYYGTQYRVRLYPPFGYSILYKEYDLTRFNHQNNTTQMGVSQDRGIMLGGPHNKDCSIWGSILGSPYFGKLPNLGSGLWVYLEVYLRYPLP